MSTESELQAQYNAAVKRWEAAKQAREAAKKERNEKMKVVKQQRDGSREYYLAWAHYWRAYIIWSEKCEQEYGAEREKCEIAVNFMIHRHGVDSKAAQIAMHRLRLAHTTYVVQDGLPYLTKWDKLRSKALQLWNLLKAEGYCAAAAAFWNAKDEFENPIRNESNGKAFREASIAANAALNKWENEDDRTDWDASKPKYDAELKTWNAFKPKSDEYAKALEKKFYEYIVLECIRDFAKEFFPNELVEARMKKLEDDNKQKTQEINELRKGLEQRDKENCELKYDAAEKDKEICELKNDVEHKTQEISQLQYEIKQLEDEVEQRVRKTQELEDTVREMVECIKSLTQGFQTLMRGQCQYIAESEATARTAVEREWQLWCEHTMAERRTLQESEAVASRHQYEQEWQVI